MFHFEHDFVLGRQVPVVWLGESPFRKVWEPLSQLSQVVIKQVSTHCIFV